MTVSCLWTNWHWLTLLPWHTAAHGTHSTLVPLRAMSNPTAPSITCPNNTAVQCERHRQTTVYTHDMSCVVCVGGCVWVSCTDVWSPMLSDLGNDTLSCFTVGPDVVFSQCFCTWWCQNINLYSTTPECVVWCWLDKCASETTRNTCFEGLWCHTHTHTHIQRHTQT